jgi:hypothetical protein
LTRDILKYDFKGLPQEFEILQMKQLYAEFKAEITVPHRAEFYQVLWFQKAHPFIMLILSR